MNRTYRLVWNRALRVLQVASELTRAPGAGGSGSGGERTLPHRRRLAAACAFALGLTLVVVSAPTLANQDFTIDASGTDYTGAQVNSALSLGNLTIQSSDGANPGSGNININDALSWNSNTLALIAAGNININAAVTVSGSGGLALNPGVANGSDTAVSGGTTIIGTAGALTFAGSGGMSLSGLTDNGVFDISGMSTGGVVITSLAGTGTVNLGGNTLTLLNATDTFGGLIDGTGGLTLNNGTETLSGANTFLGDTTLNGGTLSISSDGNLGSSTSGVTLNGGTLETTASFTLNHAVTVGTNGGTLQTDAGTDLTVANAITGTGSLTQNGAGTLTLDANVTIGGSQTYNGAVTLGGDVVAASTGSGAISFNSTVDGAHALTVNTSGTTTFGGAVGGATALTSLSTNVGGSTTLDGNVTTTGAQTYNDAVTLGGDVIAASTGSGNIHFASTVDGAHALTVNTSGTTTFGAVGGVTPLTSLSTNVGGSTTLGGNVTTTGAQTYDDAVTLGGGVIAASTGGGDIDFASTVDGAQSLTVNTGGAVSFGGTVGGTTALSGLTTDSGTFSATGTLDLSGDLSVTTTGGGIGQSGAWTIGGVSSLDAGSNAITLTNSGNDFVGAVSLTGGTTQITDTNALTLGTLNTGALSAVSNGVLNLGSGTVTGNLSATSNNGAISQTGALTVTGTSSLDAGTGSIALTNATNDFQGAVTATGTGIFITDANDLTIGSLTDGTNGSVSLIAGGALSLPVGAIDTGTGDLTLASDGGALATPGDLNGASLSLTGSTGITLSNNVTASGTLTLGSTDAAIIQTAGRLSVGGVTTVTAGSGAITLTAAGNDFVGAVSLTGGTTQITDMNALTLGTLNTGALSAVSNGALNLGSGSIAGNLGATSNNGAISQTGALTVTGTGTLDAGSGSITLADAGNDFQGAVSATGTGISISDAGDLNIAGLSDGANGSVSLIAGGSLSLSTGAIDTGSGDLTLASNGGTLTSPGDLSGGNISLTGNTGMTLANNVTATYSTTLNSAGTMLLTGNLGSGNQTYLGSGTLQIGNGGTTGSISGDVVDYAGTSIVFDRSDSVTYGGAISGSGSLVQNGTGVLTLTGDNTFGGGTTIAAGAGLQIGAGGTTGSIVGDIVDNGSLYFDRSDALTSSGAISGTGSLTQKGGGTLTLDGDSSAFAGSTDVQSGSLIVGSVAGNGAALGGDVAVDSGATLGGHGSIGGNVSVATGAHLAPGDSIGTLTVGGDATLAQNSELDFEFGAPGANFQTAGSGDSVTVGGNLELDGAVLNVTDAGGMGPGLYTLFSYGGTLTETNGGLSFGTTPANTQFQIQTLTADKQINLLDTTGMTLDFWNADGTATSTQMGGGSGTWSTTSPVWTDANADVTAAMQPQPGFAIFGGTAGTVTVDGSDGAVSATGLQFASDGYSMSGDTLTLVGTNGAAPIIRVGDGSGAGVGMTATINNVIAGSDGLVKSDLGKLVLGGANTFSGGLTINGGTLSVSSDANLGDTSNTVTLDGGTLENTAQFTTVRNVVVQGDGTFQTDQDLIESGVISGSGGLVKTGNATLILTGENTFGGDTTINAGTLQIGDGGTTGSISGDVVDNGALDFNRSDGVTFAGAISGSGSLAQDGPGTLTLTAVNTFSGGTAINAGTLDATNTQALGTGGVNVYSGSTLDVSGTGTFANAVNNMGMTTVTDSALGNQAIGNGIANAYSKYGAGNELPIGGKYTGNITKSGGTLGFYGHADAGAASIENGLSLDGSYSGIGNSNGHKYSGIFGPNTNNTISNNAMSGGALSFNGYSSAGSATFHNGVALGGAYSGIGNDNAYTTVTGNTLAGGTLSFQDHSSAGTAVIDNGVTLGGSGIGINNASTGSTITGNTIRGGTVTFADSSSAGGAIIHNGVSFGTGAGVSDVAGALSDANGNQIIGGTVLFTGDSSGGSAFIDNGVGGILDISEHNGALSLGEVSGGTGSVIDLGANTLATGGNNTNDTIGGVIEDGGTSGGVGGGLTKTGTGTLTLAGVNTFTGATTISAGTLALTGDSSLADSSGVVDNGAFDISDTNAGSTVQTLSGTGNVALGTQDLTVANADPATEFGGAIGGSGGLVLSGGDLVLAGANTFTGSTTITNGTLALAGSGSIASSSGVVDNAAFDISGTSASVTIRTLSGNGSVALGAKTLTLTTADSATTFGGIIAGSGGLVLTGGDLVLTGVNTFTGSTTITNGTLVLAGSGSIASSSGVVDNAAFDISGTSAGAAIRTLSGNGSVALGAKTLTLTNADPATTFGGAIAGSGGVVLTGGDLILTGTNTFTGGTTVNGGTLQIGNGGTSGMVAGDISDNAAVVFDRSDDVTFAGAISGNGSLVQGGTGALTLNGASNAFAGTTQVRSGTLIIGDDTHTGASLGGNMTVDAGATIGGTGAVGGLDAFGTVSPGDSIGTLHVSGDATFEKGSTFQVEASSTGASDQLAVTGTVSIKGGNTLVVGQGTNWLPHTDYTIITADAGVAGQFASVSDNLTFLDPVLTYQSNAVELSLQRNDVNFNAVADTLNQRATGTGANGLGWNSPLYNVLVFLDPATARAAFDQLSGELHASEQTARVDDSRFVREAMDQRLREGGTGALEAWAHVWGHWGSVDGDGNAAKLSNNGDGLLVGADLPVGAQGRVGFTGGSARNSLSVQDRNSWGRTTSDWLGVYGGFGNGPFALRTGLAYAWDRIPVNRQVEFPGISERLSSNAIGNTLTGFIEGAWKIHTSAGEFEPYLNLAHVRLSTDSTTEVGGDAALHVNSERENVSFSTLGARGSWQLGSTVLHGGLGWQHAFGDKTPQRTLQFVSGGDAFTIYGVPVAKNAAVVNLGADWKLKPNLTLDASYNGQWANSAKDQAAKLSLDFSF